MADNGSIKKSCYCRAAVENFDVAKRDGERSLILELDTAALFKKRAIVSFFAIFTRVFTNDSIIHAIEKFIYVRELKSFLRTLSLKYEQRIRRFFHLYIYSW